MWTNFSRIMPDFKRFFVGVVLFNMLTIPSLAYEIKGEQVRVDISSFGGILSSSGSSAQALLQTIDSINIDDIPDGSIYVRTHNDLTAILKSNYDTAYTYRITSASATAPLSLGITGNALTGSIQQATNTSSGYLSSVDWNAFNAKQPAGDYLISVTVSPGMTGSGTSTSPLGVDDAVYPKHGVLTGGKICTAVDSATIQCVSDSLGITSSMVQSIVLIGG